MNKQLFGFLAPIFLVAPLMTGCNSNSSDFNMNDDVCVNYLKATTSKNQFKAIYPNISSRSKVSHDISVPYLMECRNDGSDAYYFHIAHNKDFKDEIVEVRNLPLFYYDNLIPGKQYYWKITGTKTEDVLNQGSFTVNKNNVRWINAPSVGNLRDLGGWSLPNGKHIKFGKIYRGRNCDFIDNNDKKLFKDVLKINTQIDLRKHDDSGHPGECPFVEEGTPYVNYYYYDEMLAYDTAIIDIDNDLLGPCINPDPSLDGKVLTGAQMFKNIFDTLAEPKNYPVYFHCSAGADRTGTLAFLIEGLLGVSEEDMTRDYELTAFCQKVVGGRLRREPNEAKDDFDYTKDYFNIDDQKWPNPPSQAHWPKLLKKIGDFGDNPSSAIESFLKQKCEISQETLDKVRENLIE